jgi:hypothetical protein
MTQIAQDADKDRPSLKQDVADFDTALGKIAASTPAVSAIASQVKTLKTWVEARKLIETAIPAKGAVAKLPAGSDVTIVFDPTLASGTAIVLSDTAILIGRDGANPLTITTGNAAEALGLPIVTGSPLPDAEGEEINSGILISNPTSTRGTVNYNLNGNHYVSKAGMQQRLTETSNGRPWVIEFDQGGNFGRAIYTLQSGTFYFTPTDRGWQLYRQKYEVLLDNSQSNQEFSYVFRGQNEIVPAGETRTLTSTYPVYIRFDRGNGSQFVTRTTSLTVGSLQIGVNANDNLWDLFPMDGNKREPARLQPFNADAASTK